ncbi:MAG: alpha/beta fold hydrolase [Mycobacterium leprae]
MSLIALLPGFACQSWIWDELRAELAAQHDLILIDWPADHGGVYNTPGALADWAIQEHLPCGTEMFLVGHSMGGLVALEVATQLGARVKGVALLESFLTPPSEFFRNLLMDSAPDDLRSRVTAMLACGKQESSAALRASLGRVDYLDTAYRLAGKITALYGDRGCGDMARVRSALAWPAPLMNQVSLRLVSSACHFPMLENPKAVLGILNEAGL